MSLSAQENGAYPQISSGKTPPPAPSAAFAKRAREIQAADGLSARYRPPALRAMASSGSPSNDHPSTANVPVDTTPLPPTNYPQGFRRARAGTLPSNVQLAAQRFAAASETLQSQPVSTDSFLDTYSQQPSATTANASMANTRPALRHSASIASSAATSAVTERNSRLRSGSLTLPGATGLSNAFGSSSIFSTSWLSNNRNGSNLSNVDEMRSVTSMDSADDFDVHTLGYLGIDDNLRQPQAATITELRSQAQAAIAGNLANPPRLRASTVSNPYRLRSAAASSTLLSTPNGEDEDELLDAYNSGYGNQQMDNYNDGLSPDYYSNQLVAKGFKQSQHLGVNNASIRPRAISVGMLEDPARVTQRNLSALDQQTQNLYGGALLGDQNSLAGSLALAAGSTTLNKMPQANITAANRYISGPDAPATRVSSYLAAPTNQGRSLSPKTDGMQAQQMQVPTRSLWIGNLDNSVTSEQLIHVFAPYGAIESLRLLPEKECGFVNFVDQEDAIRAKDDVLNRLQGQIGMQNGQAVRIGFGKAESAPVAPAKGAQSSGSGPTNAATPKGVTNSSSGGLSGIESQLQSTPTRALWIGSIPSATTPATILSVFSPYGPIESARVLTHKNCGFINFERLDDAVRARKALNGRDVLGSDVGAIRIGFAKVPVKNGAEGANEGEIVSTTPVNANIQGVGDLSVGATITALRDIKGASTIPADQQLLNGAIENYRSNLLLSMVGSGIHSSPSGKVSSVTEQQMIMKELSGSSPDAEADIAALAEFRPPTMYYTSIPLVTERPNNRRWDASKLRELRKRLDSGTLSVEEIDQVAADFLDGEIVDLASDWLGNTVVQKLFEKCSPAPRFAMLERISPHLAMIGIHKNGTWAAQKIIECVQTPEEIALIAQNLRAFAPPLLLDQFGNYVVQCCLRFGAPANDFIFDAMIDRLWEVAQGRFGARSMRACLESSNVTVSQQRRVATAVILNSIPLATNPNGALLLTWLLDTSGFPSRYKLLAPRFTPHLSHLCTHKLASLTVLRIVNQKVEPEASAQIVDSLFSSTGDHVLTDVLGDQVNGVAVVHKILTSPFINQSKRGAYLEATKRVLIELKVIATQAYRRLIEEVGLPVSGFAANYAAGMNQSAPGIKKSTSQGSYYGSPTNDQNLASMMAALQMGGQSHMTPQHSSSGPQLQIDPAYQQNGPTNGRAPRGANASPGAFSPSTDPFNPFAANSPALDNGPPRNVRRNGGANNSMLQQTQMASPQALSPSTMQMQYNAQSPSLGQAGGMMNVPVIQSPYGIPQQQIPQQAMYHQAYAYPMYQQQGSPNIGAYQA
ncbi:pumilio rrm domain-containing [Pyrrhoderma noxium]|uniref:Pumilio rrm domain-containing n=1 Tax=Pyrrhoderma noxium TaxID=2282107 RepID=A0A286UXN0_9AGAM|nr:pumilio rrm domain-containing [Pyrrhoderma noxium]